MMVCGRPAPQAAAHSFDLSRDLGVELRDSNRGDGMMRRATLSVALLALFTGSVAGGCLGTSGLSGKLKKWNLEATENRWGREGIFFLLNALWIQRICTILDLFIFNSIEFWSGENPLNGKSPLVDVPMSAVQQMGFRGLERAQVERVSENAAKLRLGFENGDRLAFDVLRAGDAYTVSYQGRVFFEGRIDSGASPVASVEAVR
jgi:hypothetical protein